MKLLKSLKTLFLFDFDTMDMDKELKQTQKLHTERPEQWYESIIQGWNDGKWYDVQKINDTTYIISASKKHGNPNAFHFGLGRDLSDIGGTQWSAVGIMKFTTLKGNIPSEQITFASYDALTKLEKVFVRYLDIWSREM